MFLQDLAGYLHSIGAGVYDEIGGDSTIFLIERPSTPSDLVFITSTSGPRSSGKGHQDILGIQILIRDTDVLQAENKAQFIFDNLHGMYNCFLGETWVFGCWGVQSSPVPIGKDSLERYEYSINLEVTVRNDRSTLRS